MFDETLFARFVTSCCMQNEVDENILSFEKLTTFFKFARHVLIDHQSSLVAGVCYKAKFEVSLIKNYHLNYCLARA